MLPMQCPAPVPQFHSSSDKVFIASKAETAFDPFAFEFHIGEHQRMRITRVFKFIFFFPPGIRILFPQ